MFYGPLKRTTAKLVPSSDLHRNKRTGLPHFPTILALKDALLDQPLNQLSQVGLCNRSCETIFSLGPPRSLQKLDRSRTWFYGSFFSTTTFELSAILSNLLLLLLGGTSIIDISVNNGQNDRARGATLKVGGGGGGVGLTCDSKWGG